ncbi:MAG: hypothetical protein ABH896_02905 [Candidatus Jacksonbacteria bacterium]
MQTITQTTRISASLPAILVEEIKKISLREKITQSSLIKKALDHWLQNKFKKDVKALGKINFDDLPSEDEWALIQSAI